MFNHEDDRESDSFPWDDLTRCPRHPREVISNGIFDAPCAACEGEADQESIKWEYEHNPNRIMCSYPPDYLPLYIGLHGATCLDVPVPEDDIPF